MLTFTGNTLRAVRTEVLADCPFSIAQEYAEAFFRQAQSGAAGRIAPALIQRRVTMTFDSHHDATEAGRRHDELHLQWNLGTLLPDFRGTVRFRIDGRRTRIVVGLSYCVPFGMVGRLIDWLAGAPIAHARTADLAARLAVYLEQRQLAWRAALPDLTPQYSSVA